MRTAILRFGVMALVACTFSPVAAAIERGWASWYGREVGWHRMADGERFNPQAFTAASRTIPLGARVRVFNYRTRTSVTVRITDRGPSIHARILDLAEAPARVIGCLDLCFVSVEVLHAIQKGKIMKIVMLEDHEHAYLKHVVESYTAAGMPPGELAIASDLWEKIQRAQSAQLSSTDLGKARLAGLGPHGVAFDFAQEEPVQG